ncbi:MAG TPA: CerR family C-terminal domain-containing protein [Woeseiaceae bacterium]|nr:CerR family C-terminal domain-containing protein [Woeseiaceae bacterium]
MKRKSPSQASRGDATREALLAAAIDIFGRDGFHAASTRAIADAAGVNQALIGYHFRNKPGLYRAALQQIADSIKARLGPRVADVERQLGTPGARTARAARQVNLKLILRLTDALVGVLMADESAAWARLILREQQDPSAAFDTLYEGVMGRLLEAVTTLVLRLRGRGARQADARLTAVTIVGQALVFRAGRAAVLRQLGWRQTGPREIRRAQASIRRNVTAMLAEDSPT